MSKEIIYGPEGCAEDRAGCEQLGLQLSQSLILAWDKWVAPYAAPQNEN